MVASNVAGGTFRFKTIHTKYKLNSSIHKHQDFFFNLNAEASFI